MSKIDTTKIAGFGAMTPEEQLKALLDYEINEPQVVENPNEVKYKELISKANAEASEWKKKYNATLTEQERLEIERQEHDKEINEKLAYYEQQERVSGYAKQLMGIGYTPDEAIKMAESLPKGVGEEYFNLLKDSRENLKKSLEAETLKNQPALSTGNQPNADDIKTDPVAESFRKGAMGF